MGIGPAAIRERPVSNFTIMPIDATTATLSDWIAMGERHAAAAAAIREGGRAAALEYAARAYAIMPTRAWIAASERVQRDMLSRYADQVQAAAGVIDVGHKEHVTARGERVLLIAWLLAEDNGHGAYVAVTRLDS